MKNGIGQSHKTLAMKAPGPSMALQPIGCDLYFMVHWKWNISVKPSAFNLINIRPPIYEILLTAANWGQNQFQK